MDVELSELGSLVRHGAETPLEVRDAAFRVWIQLGRSWKRTAEHTRIGASTLRLWADRDHWEERRRQQAAAFLPGMSAETAVALKIAAHNAGLRLQQIAWESAELGIKPDAKEVQALSLIVDRGGHAPAKPDSTTAQRTERSALPPLTDDQRRILADRIANVGLPSD